MLTHPARAQVHGLNLIHSDLKPENVLIKSYGQVPQALAFSAELDACVSECSRDPGVFGVMPSDTPAIPSPYFACSKHNNNNKQPRFRHALNTRHAAGAGPGQGDRLRLELLHPRRAPHLRSVAVLPCARGHTRRATVQVHATRALGSADGHRAPSICRWPSIRAPSICRWPSPDGHLQILSNLALHTDQRAASVSAL